MNCVYENVSRYATKKNMTIQKIESKAHLGNGTIGKWRKSSPSLSNVIKVAEVLNVSPASLLKQKGE